MRVTIVAVLASASLAGCQAQSPAKNNVKAEAAANTVPPPTPGNPADNPDMTGFAKAVDTDGDGRMSRTEWTAQGLPSSSFNMFEKGRGYVTLSDYQNNAAPAGIDLDGDGKVTIAEFKQFDRRMSTRMPPAD